MHLRPIAEEASFADLVEYTLDPAASLESEWLLARWAPLAATTFQVCRR